MPPSSASRPRPCTKIWLRALTVTSSIRPLAAAGRWSARRQRLVLRAHGGRRVLVLDVERRQRARQLVGHGDHRPAEIDRACKRRRATQRALHRQVADIVAVTTRPSV